MVKEVEFSNASEILGISENYSNAADQPLFDGYLSTENGHTLNVITHIPLHGQAVAQRQLFLFYGNVDFDNKTINYTRLDATELDYRQVDQEYTDREYSFDLSTVLTIPRKIYTTGGTSEITIELYTYEANITTDYGTKRLSVPYSITSDSMYQYEESIDGLYRLIMTDFDPWVSTRTYGKGDIVEVGSSLMMSTIVNNTDLPAEANWAAPTDDDILYFSRGVTKTPPVRAFITDILISKYAKYNLIKNSLLSTSFKEYDNEKAHEMTLLLQNLRERAKFQLLAHKPADAAYNLQLLKLVSSSDTDTTKIHTYDITYTT